MTPTYTLSQAMCLICECRCIKQLLALEGVIEEEIDQYSPFGFGLLQELIQDKKTEFIYNKKC